MFDYYLRAPCPHAGIKPVTEGTLSRLFIAEFPAQEQDLTCKYWLNEWINEYSVELPPSVLQRRVNMDLGKA